MIQAEIRKEAYETPRDATLHDLIKFQSFFRGNIKNYRHCNKMRPVSNQPAKFYGTVENHNFDIINEITSAGIKVWPIADQADFYANNAEQFISGYLCPFSKTVYTITDTQSLSKHFANLLSLQDEEKDASYYVEPLLINIPVLETIDYILNKFLDKNDQIYLQKINF